MVICHNKKCIFIHIPKTAGTSIEQFLKDNNKNEIDLLGVKLGRAMHHYRAIDLKKEIPELFKKYFKFSIVRNPYDRLLSEYYWCRIPEAGFKFGKTKTEFLNYVSKVIKNKNFYSNIYHEHFMPQYMFIYDSTIQVDNLFKYEDLDWTIDYLKKKLSIENDLKNLNKSRFTKEDWNENQKEIIYNLYKNDFLLFNYQK